MLIRELDSFLDLIWHGFWKWPVVAVVLSSITVTCFLKDSTWSSMASLTHTTPFTFILIGLSMLLIFSRIFGTTTFWIAVLDDRNLQSAAILVKSTVQEAIELLGYILISYGSVLHTLEQSKRRTR